MDPSSSTSSSTPTWLGWRIVAVALLVALPPFAMSCGSQGDPSTTTGTEGGVTPTPLADSIFTSGAGQALAKAYSEYQPTDDEQRYAAAFWVVYLGSRASGTTSRALLDPTLSAQLQALAAKYPSFFTRASPYGSIRISTGSLISRGSDFACANDCIPDPALYSETISDAVDFGISSLVSWVAKRSDPEVDELWGYYEALDGANEIDAAVRSIDLTDAQGILGAVCNIISGAGAIAEGAELAGAVAKSIATRGGLIGATYMLAKLAADLGGAYLLQRLCHDWHGQYCCGSKERPLSGSCVCVDVVCAPPDLCHVAGACDESTGVCLAGPTKSCPGEMVCDLADGNCKCSDGTQGDGCCGGTALAAGNQCCADGTQGTSCCGGTALPEGWHCCGETTACPADGNCGSVDVTACLPDPCRVAGTWTWTMPAADLASCNTTHPAISGTAAISPEVAAYGGSTSTGSVFDPSSCTASETYSVGPGGICGSYTRTADYAAGTLQNADYCYAPASDATPAQCIQVITRTGTMTRTLPWAP